jgi:hypothetical protein
MLGHVAVAAADGRIDAFANPLVNQVPIFTDVITPGADGCLGAKATFIPQARHRPLDALPPRDQGDVGGYAAQVALQR